MREARWPILIAVVCLGLYSNSLTNSFHYDDVHSIVNNINLWKAATSADFSARLVRFFEDPGMFSVDPNKGMYRPVLLMTYLLNFQFGDGSVAGFHVVNLLIHVVNVLLVYWLSLMLIRRQDSARIASLLFAVHPLCTEPVNYISSRSDSLSSLFYLLGICLFIWGGGRKEREKWQSFGAAGALALGLLSKSTVITLPAVLLLYDFLDAGRTLGGLKRRWLKNHAPMWLVSGCYVATIMQNQFLPGSLGNPVRSAVSQLLTQSKAVTYYLQQLVLPTHLSVEPQFSEGTLLSPAVVGFALLLLASLVTLLWRHYGATSSLTLFLVSWPIIAMLPVMVMPLNVFVNERRLYLPCVAFCIGLAIAMSFLRRRRLLQVMPGLNLLTGSLLVCFGTLIVQRNEVWADDTSLWQDAVAKAPLMPRNHLYLGNVRKDLAKAALEETEVVRHWNSALDSYRRVIEIGSDEELSLRALNNQGSVYFSLGDMEAAERVYRESLRINPNYADALINYGSVLVISARSIENEGERRARVHEAIDRYKKALKVSPNDKNAHGSLGVAYHDLGDFDMAIKSYKRSLSLDPYNPKTWKNLGGVYFQLGKTAISPAGSTLEVVRKARKDLRTALWHYEKSLKLSPEFSHALRGRDQVSKLLLQVDEFLRQNEAQER